MALYRYSAVEQFGVPIDGSFESSVDGLARLMAQNNIELQDIPAEATDITPYYWKNPVFRYFVSMKHPEGPAIVEMMPRHSDSMATELISPRLSMVVNARHVEIPTDQEVVLIAGPGPRFAGQLCVHEAIAYVD